MVSVHVNDIPGDKQPFVLLHGWPLDSESWAPQCSALSQAGHRVVTIDRRGFGQSDKPEHASDYSYDLFARDLHNVLTDLDLSHAILVGFSMGGGDVARYVSTYGTDRVSGVVFAAAVTPCLYISDDNPSGGVGPDDVAGMKANFLADREGFLAGFTPVFYSAGDELKVSQEDVDAAAVMQQRAHTTAAATCIDLFSTEDFRPDLATISTPALVIHGDSDNIVPAQVSADRMAEHIPHSTMVVIEDGPHGVNTSHPAEFNEALLNFAHTLAS